MTNQPSIRTDFSVLKERQRQTWGSGDYSLPGGLLTIISENLCEAVDLRAGQKVLDIATGTGNTAIAAARRHCNVTGIDYTPSLLVKARERAAVEGLSITFIEGDAEALPFPDDSFDVVLSSLGVMFAPDQELAASELLRVCRAGGKIGLASWSPGGSFGQMGRTLASYAPPPPPGLKPPMLWGTEDRLQDLFGAATTFLQVTQRTFMHRYRSAQHAVEFMRTYFGPVATAFQVLEPEQRQQLEKAMIAVYEDVNIATDGTLVAPAEYLEVIAIRN